MFAPARTAKSYDDLNRFRPVLRAIVIANRRPIYRRPARVPRCFVCVVSVSRRFLFHNGVVGTGGKEGGKETLVLSKFFQRE